LFLKLEDVNYEFNLGYTLEAMRRQEIGHSSLVYILIFILSKADTN